MNIGLTFPIYITSKRHFEIFEQFIYSVEESKIDGQFVLHKIAIINVITSEYMSKLVYLLDRYNYSYMMNPYGNSVSGAWNTGIKKCFERDCELVMIPNTDIVLKDNCLENLIRFWMSSRDKYGLWCARPLNLKEELNTAIIEDITVEVGLYSFFSVSKQSINSLCMLEKDSGELYSGYFDTNFSPAYFEDNDYDRRLHLANLKPATTHSAIYWHLGSQTIRNDEDLQKNTNISFEKNKKYFNIKWNTIVNGGPKPYDDNGFVGAFGKAGHLTGNYNLAYKKLGKIKTDEILRQLDGLNVIDCNKMSVDEMFVVLFNSINKNIKLLIDEKHKSNGSLMCALSETGIKCQFVEQGISLSEKYNKCVNIPSDINEHLPVLNKYASECTHVTNMGTSIGNSAFAFLYGLSNSNSHKKKLICYDIVDCENICLLQRCSTGVGVELQFIKKDVRKVQIEETDLLFIDTLHTYDQLKIELELHAGKAKKYIIFHDIVSFGINGEIAGTKGLMPAIYEFLDNDKCYRIKDKYENNNGLLVLERI